MMGKQDTALRPPLNRRRLEHFFLQAWPAREEVEQAGWVLRAHDGYTGRANSVTVLAPPAAGTPVIDDVERFYAARGLPPKFRLLSFVDSRVLDEQLARRGYRSHSATLVLTLPVKRAVGTDLTIRPGSELAAPHLDQWLNVYNRCRGRPPASGGHVAHGQILAQVQFPMQTAVLLDRGTPVACGAAVSDGSRCALFDIAVQSGRRREGWGRMMVERLLQWGAAQGCRWAALQVEIGNYPARHLYRRFRFRATYFYWYRTDVATPDGASYHSPRPAGGG